MVNPATDYIVNIDATNAAALLIDESHKRPVVVDFWADWCAPCKVLMPLLEKIATEYQGAFLLAKVNADQQPGIAQQLGVRNLPTVMVIQGGQPVDGFAGAQPESVVRRMLEKYLPKPWDGLLSRGLEAIAQGDFNAALAPLRQAWTESKQRYDITLAYTQALIECLRLDEAETLLDGVKAAERDADYEQLRAYIAAKREASVSPEIQALEQRLAANADDLDLRYQLAEACAGNGRARDAMEHLVTILRQDREHAGGATKRRLLDLIGALGKGDPLAVEYQRKLYSLLY
jgi:putative thioredoxin